MKLVERILAAKGGTGIPACASAASQTRMSVAQWEREIDDLPSSRRAGLRRARRVYRLYGLTAAEIKLVEESKKR
jgi:hypothetical protein